MFNPINTMKFEDVLAQSLIILKLTGEFRIEVETEMGEHLKLYKLVDTVTGTFIYGSHNPASVGAWIDGFATAKMRQNASSVNRI